MTLTCSTAVSAPAPSPPISMLNNLWQCRLAKFLPVRRPPQTPQEELHNTSTLKWGKGGTQVDFKQSCVSTCQNSSDNSPF